MARHAVWLVGLLGLLIVLGVSWYARSLKLRIPHEHPRASASSVLSPQVTIRESLPSPSDPDVSAPEVMHGVGYWDDPSLPASMKREPPAPRIPPEARPKRPAIDPPQAEWRRLRQDDEAIAY
jgi:hypothetical protein